MRPALHPPGSQLSRHPAETSASRPTSFSVGRPARTVPPGPDRRRRASSRRSAASGDAATVAPPLHVGRMTKPSSAPIRRGVSRLPRAPRTTPGWIGGLRRWPNGRVRRQPRRRQPRSARGRAPPRHPAAVPAPRTGDSAFGPRIRGARTAAAPRPSPRAPASGSRIPGGPLPRPPSALRRGRAGARSRPRRSCQPSRRGRSRFRRPCPRSCRPAPQRTAGSAPARRPSGRTTLAHPTGRAGASLRPAPRPRLASLESSPRSWPLSSGPCRSPVPMSSTSPISRASE